MKHSEIRLLPCLVSAVLILAAACGDKPSGAVGGSPAEPVASSETEAPADSEPIAPEEYPGIWLAAATGDKATVESAIKRGLDVNAKEPIGGGTILMTAAFAGQTEIVELLIEKGAELETKNHEGATALYNAAFFAHPETLKALIKAGGDVNAVEKNGRTALDNVTAPWTPELEGIYKLIEGILRTDLDIQRIKETRGEIAGILKANGGQLSSEL